MSETLNEHALKAKAQALAAEIHANTPTLTLEYVIHRQGQLQSALHMIEDQLLEHPAGRIATSISRRIQADFEPSQFHGLCLKSVRGTLGIGSTLVKLGVISLNLDQYDDFYEACLDLYRLTWMALELSALMQAQPPEKIPDRPLNIKRSPLGDARVNLRADLMSILFIHDDGYEEALAELAYARSMHVLTRNQGHQPERYAFPLVAQALEFAFKETIGHLSKDKSRLERYTELATELGDSVTDDQLRLWGRLCDMSQEMAWRGYKPETILGAAVHTSEDAFLKSIMYKVAEYTRTQPQELDHIHTIFNSFVMLDSNRSTHLVMIEHSFDKALEQSLASGGHKPFLEIAEMQNYEFLQGRFMGWCAGALQSAGQVFLEADTMGIPPAQAARIEFDGQSHLPTMLALYKLTKEIISLRNKGEVLQLPDLARLARKFGDVELLARSIDFTLAEQKRAADPKAKPIDEEIDLGSVPLDETLQIKITQQTLYERGSLPQGVVAPRPKEPDKPEAPPEFSLEDD